jgi:hypothetical protein
MATCSYCREDIPDDSTVCIRCGTFDPFSPRPAPHEPQDYSASREDLEGFPSDSTDAYTEVLHDPESLPVPPPPDYEEAESSRGGSGCWDFIKDVGCQYALGCGGLVAATVIGVIIVLIASVCAGGVGEIQCQELHNWAMDPSDPWEDRETGETLSDFKIFEIAPDVEKDRPEPGREVCPGVAQTTDGPEAIWYLFDNDGNYTIYTEPMDEPVSVPAPAPQR